MALTLLQWNAQNIKAHFAFFYRYLASINFSPDIICIQESHLKPHLEFKLKGYIPFRKDRTFARNGGVLTLIKNNISHSELICPPDIESIGIQIKTIHGVLNIFNIYNPGMDIDMDAYKHFFIDNSIICGDFNAHNPLWGSQYMDKRGQIMESLITDSNHVILNTGQGTYIVSKDKTSCIDLTMVSNSLASQSDWVVGDDELGSDHYPITITLNSIPSRESPFPTFHGTNNVDWTEFQDLTNDSFTSFVFPSNIDDIHNSIISIFDNCMEQAARTPSTTRRHFVNVPYWNSDCELAYKNKVRSKRKAHKSHLLEDYISFRRYKAICQKVIRSRQRQYWQDYCSTLNRNSNLSKVWKTVKGMKGHSSYKPIPTLNSDSHQYTTNQEKANILGQHFATISSSSNFHSTFLLNKTKLQSICTPHIIQKPNNNSVLNVKITLKELTRAIRISRNSAPGPDKITYNVYKHLPSVCLRVLLDFFNLIWTQGRLPTAWKHAIVCPIPKPGKDPCSPVSYRPIALTSTMCKIMEQIIVDRLTW